MTRKNTGKSKGKESFDFELNIPWYLWALAVLVFAGVIFWLVFSSAGTFMYKDMVFVKEDYGNDLLIYKYSYFCRDDGLTKCSVYLHNDPRKNEVPINADIVFPQRDKNVKLSIDVVALSNCSDSRAAVGELTQFIVINDFNVTVGTPNLEEANKLNVSVMNCDTNPNDFMILLKTGEKSKISQQGSCYNIEVGNCEVFQGVEKFIVESIIQAKDRAK